MTEEIEKKCYDCLNHFVKYIYCNPDSAYRLIECYRDYIGARDKIWISLRELGEMYDKDCLTKKTVDTLIGSGLTAIKSLGEEKFRKSVEDIGDFSKKLDEFAVKDLAKVCTRRAEHSKM